MHVVQTHEPAYDVSDENKLIARDSNIEYQINNGRIPTNRRVSNRLDLIA